MTIVVPLKEGTVPGLQPQGGFLIKGARRVCALHKQSRDNGGRKAAGGKGPVTELELRTYTLLQSFIYVSHRFQSQILRLQTPVHIHVCTVHVCSSATSAICSDQNWHKMAVYVGQEHL